MIFALVPHIFHGSRMNADTRMRSAAPLSRVSLVKWRRSSSHIEFTVFVVASYPALIL